MKSITVFTPTFNRANYLLQVYESLCRQTSNDFMWLVVDDGSSDDTGLIVSEWQNEEKIKIEYHYKINGGLHTAYNLAISKAKTELFVCIDSDDFMPDSAVEDILCLWQLNGSASYAGIIGLDYNLEGKPLGGLLPNIKSVYITELTEKYKFRGDTKMIHRTSLLKQVAPMPSFNDEKNFNPIYLFLQVDQKLPLLILNKNLCFVEYHSSGMSNNIFYQYRNSPNSFAAMRILNMNLKRTSYFFVIKNAIHYVSSCLFAKEKKWLQKTPLKITTILIVPLGILLYFYILIKTYKNA
jgi:glycosyltransferase involved in cell wall biosynthesis